MATHEQEHSVFVSYRRGDAPGVAGRLFDWLSDRLGESRVFMDVDSIDLGMDFVEALERAVESCEVLLALIGPEWLAAKDTDGNRRIDRIDDYVRVEIQTGLERGVRVVPVLVAGGVLPSAELLPEPLKPLVRRQAIRLSNETFRSDAKALIDRLERALEQAVRPAAETAQVAPAELAATEATDSGVSEERDNPWTARCVVRKRSFRRIELTLTHDSHVIEFKYGLWGAPLRIDGERVANTEDGSTVGLVRAEFPLTDGTDSRTGMFESQTSFKSFDGIERLRLLVDGQVLYSE